MSPQTEEENALESQRHRTGEDTQQCADFVPRLRHRQAFGSHDVHDEVLRGRTVHAGLRAAY